jgi:hypothetical protein
MKWLFVICVALAGACADHEAGKLAKIRDEVCKCKTVSCAEAALARVPKDTKQPSRKAQKIAREMLGCLADVYDLDRPSTDPDAPSGPEIPGAASAGTP